MTAKIKLFVLAILIGAVNLWWWGRLANNILVGVLVGGIAFSCFLFGSAATTYLFKK